MCTHGAYINQETSFPHSLARHYEELYEEDPTNKLLKRVCYPYQVTSLHYFVISKNYEAVQVLSQHVKLIYDAHGNTPLHLAAQMGDDTSFRTLTRDLVKKNNFRDETAFYMRMELEILLACSSDESIPKILSKMHVTPEKIKYKTADGYQNQNLPKLYEIEEGQFRYALADHPHYDQEVRNNLHPLFVDERETGNQVTT